LPRIRFAEVIEHGAKLRARGAGVNARQRSHGYGVITPNPGGHAFPTPLSALTEPRARPCPGSTGEKTVHSASMEKRKPADLDDLLDDAAEMPKGHDIRSLGPSDSSDTGADMVGVEGALDSTTDRQGTGERTTVGSEFEANIGADIAADRVVESDEAGLGGGLDQAEEAQLGITDEEVDDIVRDELGLDRTER
jgi:hypothetical protein